MDNGYHRLPAVLFDLKGDIYILQKVFLKTHVIHIKQQYSIIFLRQYQKTG